ncbi:MAG: hypothetical protein A2283_23105 [Lentisphaerae bacterium RIFOXYA12_FULL_48_11]|nr:MAG: hypothetical protein A2283_23105 [Lentisphaerae bacterium RIFOXYA12_FULL_48_11]
MQCVDDPDKWTVLIMHKRINNFILAIILICTATIICHGRVYEYSGKIVDSTKALLSSGGSLAYETSVSINGSKGDLAVVGFNKPIGHLVRELGQLFKTKDIVYSGGSMGYVNIKSNGMIMKMTVLKFGNNVQTLVFKIQQSEADYLEGLQKPRGHMLKDIPVFPGSDPVFYVRDDKSNAGLAVAETSADALSVRSFFASQLSSAGWSPAMPGQTAANMSSSLLVYNRNREICCIFVDTSLSNGKNLITLLHKQQGIE